MNTGDLALIAVTLWAAHCVGDYWVQTPRQALTKDKPGWVGRRACLAHIQTYTIVQLAYLIAAVLLTGLRIDGPRLLCGVAISATTHYFADRRTPLRALAKLIGKDTEWLDHGGMERLDQTWHLTWLAVAACTMAG